MLKSSSSALPQPGDPAQQQAPVQLQGTVEQVVFHSNETGFFVVKVRCQEQQAAVRMTGNSPTIVEGEFIEAGGQWCQDSRYGLQFQVQTIKSVIPHTLEGIEKYLGSGMVKGVGPRFARRLVKKFGVDVFDVIEKSPQRLTELDGISTKRVEMITAAWDEQKGIRDVMVFLQACGVGAVRAVRIHQMYGVAAIAKIRQNPYRLTLDIEGIGFKTADQLALQLGIDKTSLMRARAGIHHVLRESAIEGHCARPHDSLVEAAAALLGIAPETIEQAAEQEVAGRQLLAATIDGASCLFLPHLRRAEQGVAASVMRLMQRPSGYALTDSIDHLLATGRVNCPPLSGSQRRAVEASLQHKFSIISGGPGVGKTTVVNCIVQLVATTRARIVLCAPTGRAAKRLAESSGREAVTIHRLLKFDPATLDFRHNESNPLKVDLLVVDEVSMVDIALMDKLLRAVPYHSSVLLVGDIDQLPSVGPGAVLRDLIGCQKVPVAWLTDIFRQAKQSHIVVRAHEINRGKAPKPSKKGDKTDFFYLTGSDPGDILAKLVTVVTRRIPEKFGFDATGDIQVLAPMNRGELGAHNINTVLQQRLNGTAAPRISRNGWTFAPGDKVIQTVNNYDKEVYNGDIGFIREINLEAGQAMICFEGQMVNYLFDELDEIALAYAITIHKSQGSEYPCVVIPLAMQHYILLERNLFYTAVTRGKALVVLIGQTRAVVLATKTTRAVDRVTSLKELLAGVEAPAAQGQSV